MEYLIIIVFTVMVFAGFIGAMAFREHRRNKRPPLHTCHQGHTCRCGKINTETTEHACQNRAMPNTTPERQ